MADLGQVTANLTADHDEMRPTPAERKLPSPSLNIGCPSARQPQTTEFTHLLGRADGSRALDVWKRPAVFRGRHLIPRGFRVERRHMSTGIT
jgi:hypothetical protein